MSYLPQVNATLTAILPEATAEDWDVSEADAAAQWQGEQDAYIVQNVQTVYSQQEGAVRYIRNMTLYVGLDWASGSGFSLVPGIFVEFTIGAHVERHKVMEVNFPVVPDTGPLSGLPGQAVTLNLSPSQLATDVSDAD